MKKEFLQWFCYLVLFSILLIPFTGISFKTISGGLILGFFAEMLNSINSK